MSKWRAIIVLLLAAVATACTTSPSLYAGTTTFGSPLYHASGYWPAVIVQSNVSARWPVRQAIANWGVPVTFGQCQPNINCIQISETYSLGYENGAQKAAETRQYSVAGHASTVVIQFADIAPNLAGRGLETACHELGHAYGLGHDETGGCLRPGVDGFHQLPSPPESWRLHALYFG